MSVSWTPPTNRSWKGYVTDADGVRTRIRYLGFDDSWDEWPAPDRIRAAGR